jgi:hypothetical protein
VGIPASRAEEKQTPAAQTPPAAAPADASAQAGRTGNESAEMPPVRIVPRVGWSARGVADPTGRFVVCPPGYSCRLVVVVDVKLTRPAWIVPIPKTLDPLQGFAFSPSGKTLVMAGRSGGLVLDLDGDRLLDAPWLRGDVVAFSPDGAHVWAARGGDAQGMGRAKDDGTPGLYCFTPRGVQEQVLSLTMNIPASITFQNGGKDLVVEGWQGKGLGDEAGGTIQPVAQTFAVDTGRSTMVLGEVQNGFGPREEPSKRLPATTDQPKRQIREIRDGCRCLWDAAAERLTVFDGKSLNVWAPLNAAALARTISAKGSSLVPLGQGSGGLLYCQACYDILDLPQDLRRRVEKPNKRAVHLVTRVDPNTGAVTPLPIDIEQSALKFHSNPDRLAVLRHAAAGSVEVWNLDKLGQPVTVKVPGKGGWKIAWAEGPSLTLAVQAVDEKGVWQAHFYDAVGGLIRTIPVGGWSAMDLAGQFVAFGVIGEGRGKGQVLLIERATGTECRQFPVAPDCSWPQPTFVSGSQLLITDGIGHGRAELWDIAGTQPKWSAATFGAVKAVTVAPDAGLAVVQYKGDGADILRLDDGRRLPLSAAAGAGAAWNRPTPILKRRLVLDSTYAEYGMIDLIDARTGLVAATYATLGASDWMVWTPDGYWTGTDGAVDWAGFYRGRDALSPEAAAALRKPAIVSARIKDMLDQARPARR